MRLSEVAELLEEIAPRDLAEDWDNVGWQVIQGDQAVQGVLVSLDPLPGVVDEAVRLGANLLVTHHPVFFRPFSRLSPDTLGGAAALAAALSGVSILSLHTNLDAAPDGTSWALADALGIRSGQVLSPGSVPGTGYGVVGHAPMRSLSEWVTFVAERLDARPLALSGQLEREHEVVSVMGGSGASLWETALGAGATLYITADIRYHEAQQAIAAGLSLIAVDHYASEQPVIKRLAEHLRAKLSCPVAYSGLRTSPWETQPP